MPALALVDVAGGEPELELLEVLGALLELLGALPVVGLDVLDASPLPPLPEPHAESASARTQQPSNGDKDLDVMSATL